MACIIRALVWIWAHFLDFFPHDLTVHYYSLVPLYWCTTRIPFPTLVLAENSFYTDTKWNMRSEVQYNWSTARVGSGASILKLFAYHDCNRCSVTQVNVTIFLWGEQLFHENEVPGSRVQYAWLNNALLFCICNRRVRPSWVLHTHHNGVKMWVHACYKTWWASVVEHYDRHKGRR